MAGLNFFVLVFVLVVVRHYRSVVRFGGFLNVLEQGAGQQVFLLKLNLLNDLGVFIQLAALGLLRRGASSGQRFFSKTDVCPGAFCILLVLVGKR